MPRLYFAVGVGGEARDRILQWMERAQKASGVAAREARWTAPENIHLTLKFLGEIPEEAVPEIREAGFAAAVEESPTLCRLGEPGSFLSRRGSTILRVPVDEGQALRSLAGKLESRLERRGYPRESRPYFAHITLARVRSPGTARQLLLALRRFQQEIGFLATTLILYRSELTRGGPIYTADAEMPLLGASA